MNNPGYSRMIIAGNRDVKSLVFSFFQLDDFQRLGVVNFVDYDVMAYTGMDLNNAQSVRDYVGSLLYNLQAYGGYIAHNMGLRDFLAQGSMMFFPIFNRAFSDEKD